MNSREATSDVDGVQIFILWDDLLGVIFDRYYSEVSQDIIASIELGAMFLQFFRKFLLYSNRCTCLENAGKGAQTCK